MSTIVRGTVAYITEADRISKLLAWNQELNKTDELFWRDHLLADWEESKTRLETAKNLEMIQRKKFVDFVSDPNKKSGTERVELANGFQAKMVKKINYGFIKNADGKTDKERIEAALQKIEATGPAGELIASRLIKWTPDLSLTEYNQLPSQFKPIIDAVIVTSEGAPTLEIVPPKPVK